MLTLYPSSMHFIRLIFILNRNRAIDNNESMDLERILHLHGNWILIFNDEIPLIKYQLKCNTTVRNTVAM